MNYIDQLEAQLKENEEYIASLERRVESLENALEDANGEIEYWKEQRYD